jgi:hypothetical protein
MVQRPGEWMSESELEQLVSEMQEVSRATVTSGPLEYGVIQGERRYLESALITIAYQRDSGRPLAFNALVGLSVDVAGREIEVLHMGLVLVDPSVRRRGLSWMCCTAPIAVALLRSRFRPVWASNVTQVPAAFGMFSDRVARAYPGRPEARPSAAHRAIAHALVTRHRAAFGVGDDATFDSRRYVIENAYTGGSDHLKKPFSHAARHREDEYNEICRRELDYDRGDDFLQIGQLTVGTALRLALRSALKFSAVPRLQAALRLGARLRRATTMPRGATQKRTATHV